MSNLRRLSCCLTAFQFVVNWSSAIKNWRNYSAYPPAGCINLREGEQLQIGKGRKTWQENIPHIQVW
jgi:hypothetical protein